MSWPKGADVIQELIDRGYLEPVPANPEEAAYLIDKARLHLQTARDLAEADPEIAYDALYAAARKALTAVLRQQGLRPTREGGHEVVIQAAEAQLVPPAGPILRPYRVAGRRTPSDRLQPILDDRGFGRPVRQPRVERFN